MVAWREKKLFPQRSMKSLLTLLLWGLWLPGLAFGQINFSLAQEDQIDLAKLEISKADFLAFAQKEVEEKKPGLGTYGIVELDACRYKVNGRPLAELRTSEGKPILLLSTPSCAQLVIEKALNQGTDFAAQKMSDYERRRCVVTLSSLFRPMMEYYTIHHELMAQSCPTCEAQEKRRLDTIGHYKGKLGQFCGPGTKAVEGFLLDLSRTLDQAFAQKVRAQKP
ncbi:MAG: hypothetical protein A2600_12935 [Candidatus Lambdaproteobacteria bacterium RIFOXYD1_FULL_56_27]|uniref:Uncharacterized protein n=1 Tax=Candidatus Lambdaproteobacteria bacterium RIFOXYD2_FULL_56_26 TaxID=1817773 RepID=A0A1F6GTJ7_9PROT|nr:MAG: hypothetical protein A2426_09015 [Candidatus Lambdaproteobacteria bacterium RIFOXYC1_FULL_56_13]OGH01418.1 MAG: hypothetical protein A2557_09520 [Candidatus Lambdaproteobacteria bacterium RIFOXYD2_FULL_56_26]OGH06514.1 MAG: hypothetical protein A2600_12935 [Candidatus Lambdaproteobacteria bacterium RIFOXYD1_FULL_56_27]